MTPSQKLRSIADSTGLDGIADAIREIANEIEHNNAPAVPQGWVNASDRVPLESDGEVFIRFTDGSIGTGWATYWHGASNGFAQWTFPDPDEDRTVLEWTKNPAAPSQPVTPDSEKWCQYVAGMIFCWLQMQEGLGLSDDDEDRFVKAIAGIIQRRLWAYKPSQEPAVPQGEPFGYFRAEPFGWTDCAADDEGAKPLYERPQVKRG